MGTQMKHKIVCAGTVLLFLFSCSNQKNSVINSDVIDIEHALHNLTRLKVSDFGQTIRYIPLETPDEGLVGRNPVIKVLRNYIVIESQQSCLLFDKKDGSFIAEIGRIGQGPEEFTEVFSWTDEKEEFLYFKRAPNSLIKFNMKGNFSGKVSFSSPPGLASYYMLMDSEIIGYFNEMNTTRQYALGFFDHEGILKDTIPSFSPHPIIPDQIANIFMFRNTNLYGILGLAGIIIVNYKNDTRQIIAPNAARLWRNNETIRFKEEFVDTIYAVSGSQLIPYVTFNTGKYHWPIDKSSNAENTKELIYIADVSENNTFVFFQCIRGMLSDEPVLYNGLYHKQTGETKLGKNSDGIEDDLTRFMPFTPLGISTSGEFVSLVEVWEVLEWLENHPEVLNNEKLSFLKELNEDMNPIVILVE